MNLLEKIKKFLSRNKEETKLLSEGNQQSSKSIEDCKSDFRQSMQVDEKQRMNSLNKSQSEEIENIILQKAGVNKKLIDNPRTRKVLVDNMKDVVYPNFNILSTDELGLNNENKEINNRVRNKMLMLEIVQDIHTKWGISNDTVKFDGSKFSVANTSSKEEIICKVQGSNVSIEKTSFSSFSPMDSATIRNSIYNSDGLEVKQESQHMHYVRDWKTGKSTKIINTAQIIRQDIDTAMVIIDNNKSCLIDLLAASDKNDIADLLKIGMIEAEVYMTNGQYSQPTNKKEKNARQLVINDKISKSKYQIACKNYREKRENDNNRENR